MKLALISDIHGNLIALDAVLADIEMQSADRIINLGDVASLGGQPREVIERLQERKIPSLLGNHDAFLLRTEKIEAYEWANEFLIAFEKWTRDQLSAEHLAYLAEMKFSMEMVVDGREILLVHGSPRSYFEQILATNTPLELDEILAETTADIVIAGHTHIPLVRRYKNRLLLNTGSVGNVLAENPPPDRKFNTYRHYAEYLLLTMKDGIISAEHRHIPIDAEAVKAQFLSCGFEHSAVWWQG